MMIDAHQHFWLLAARAGQWPPSDLAAIHRDFQPADLTPHLAGAGVTGTILVQSLPSVEDTLCLLDLADWNPFIRGVVGWVDLKSDTAPAVIADLARHPALKGLRPMLQDLAPEWLDDTALDPAIRAMMAAGLRFDALVLPRHLAALRRFADRFPDLPIVIDHGAKPEIAQGGTPGWAADLVALGQRPNIWCKLSGLLTEAGTRTGIEDIRPFADTLFTVFGPDRLIWGSDWPVLELAGSYGGWLAMARELVPEDAHPAVFGGNARRFYGLD